VISFVLSIAVRAKWSTDASKKGVQYPRSLDRRRRNILVLSIAVGASYPRSLDRRGGISTVSSAWLSSRKG
jgi:hypothetical protein